MTTVRKQAARLSHRTRNWSLATHRTLVNVSGAARALRRAAVLNAAKISRANGRIASAKQHICKLRERVAVLMREPVPVLPAIAFVAAVFQRVLGLSLGGTRDAVGRRRLDRARQGRADRGGAVGDSCVRAQGQVRVLAGLLTSRRVSTRSGFRSRDLRSSTPNKVDVVALCIPSPPLTYLLKRGVLESTW